MAIDLHKHGGKLVSQGANGHEVWDFGRWHMPDETEAVLSRLPDPIFESAAPHLMGDAAAPEDVAFWEIEQQVLGKLLPTWDQGSLGSCVAHGWGRALQDMILIQIALGRLEEWPGAEVNRETIYGGSRIEVGHSPGGEGSVGAWAAEFVSKWGVLLNKKYPSVDLSDGYNIARCRKWGDQGVPDDLEPESRIHPATVAAITTTAGMEAALRNLNPISICGSKGRTMQRKPGGWCPVQGGWNHCQCFRGRFMVGGGPQSPFGGDGAAPYVGNTPAIAYGNSWADYLGSSNNTFTTAEGKSITLPAGHYLSTYGEIESELRQNDTFAVSGIKGWAVQRLPWMV